jgi:hypothetical protein
MQEPKYQFQLVWGALLILAGIGVFIRIPQVMPQIEQLDYFKPIIHFVRFSFYLLGALLIGGGAKKLYALFSESTKDEDGQ